MNSLTNQKIIKRIGSRKKGMLGSEYIALTSINQTRNVNR